jgi:hypothetical protein
VHTAIAAHDAGVRFTVFRRENAFWLPVGGEVLYPDCAFQLMARDRERSFFVELDNSGQRVQDASRCDSACGIYYGTTSAWQTVLTRCWHGTQR